MRHLAALLACLLACHCLAAAQSTPPIPAHKLDHAPTIDGVVNDGEWKDVPFVEGLFDQNTGAAYPESGRFWIAYDHDFVYFAARMQESQPGQIRANEYRTNVGLSGDDYVEFDLDLSGSTTDFNVFQINPQGATNIQLAGGRAAKREWTGEFLAKARITPTGWEAEARIPWQLMRIPKSGMRDARVNFRRFVSKSQRQLMQTYTTNQNGALTPIWAHVELPRQAVDHSIKLLPYFYAGYDPKVHGVFNSGLDLKTSLTENIALVGSVNPDFRNIENQILSIDFSRFERLAGETRPFFQEGRSYLNSAIFYSQRIRNFDVGVNTYGKLTDKTSFGFLDTNNFGDENDLVGIFTSDPDPTLSLRASVTSQSTPGNKNDAYLLRAAKQFGPLNFQLRDIASKDTTEGTGHYRDATLQYTDRGLTLYSVYTHTAAEFDPKLGFFPERDFKGVDLGGQYNVNYDHGFMNDIGFGYFHTSYDHTDGTSYRRDNQVLAQGTIRNGPYLVYIGDFASFEGSTDHLNTVSTGFPRGNPYSNIAWQHDWGRQAGLIYRSDTVSTAYRLNSKMQLTLRQQSVAYAGHNDQTILSANYDLGGDRFISGRAVRNQGDTNFYVAYRRTGNQGAEYFLILGDPNATKYRNSLILKMVVPFQIGGHTAKKAS